MVRSTRRRRAFTLVELLVVIGIIALLISILMPALTKAKNQALMIKCQNQGRQIYLASQMFAADNKGHLPRPAVGGEVDVDAEKKCYFTMPDWGIVNYEKGVMVQYMPGGPESRHDVWYCPGDLGEVTQGGGAPVNGEKRNFSYSINANVEPLMSGAPRKLGILLQTVKQSSRKIMIYEEQAPNDLWCLLYDTNMPPPPPGATTFPAFRGDDLPTARHAGQRYGLINRGTAYGSAAWARYGPIGRGNYTFFDGHVETLTPNDLYKNPKSFMIKIDE